MLSLTIEFSTKLPRGILAYRRTHEHMKRFVFLWWTCSLHCRLLWDRDTSVGNAFPRTNTTTNSQHFIIIILYFENVTFFHAKLGSDVCPRVDNQTSGDTLEDLTRPLVEKSPLASYPPMGIEASFWWRDALPHQPVRIREESLESGNLFSGSWNRTKSCHIYNNPQLLNAQNAYA